MKSFKFKYWYEDRKRVVVIKASSLFNARIRFLMEIPHTDIISIEEVTKE